MDKVITTLADKMLAELESAKITGKYNRPFKVSKPHNVASGKAYTGMVNLFCIYFSMKQSPAWGTFLNWKDLGYHVKSGTGIPIFGPINTKTVTDIDGNERSVTIPPRVYHVFNADDTFDKDGNPYSIINKDMPPIDIEIQSWLQQCNATVVEGDEALYSRKDDTIELPPYNTFISATEYWATYAHELIHWTGHATRLGRLANPISDISTRAYEELVAEFGAELLLNKLGIEQQDIRNDHIMYLQHWAKLINDDKSVIKQAIIDAHHAVEYLQSTHL